MDWVQRQWKAAQRSYEREQAVAGSHPSSIVFGAGLLIAIFCAVAFIEPMKSMAGFSRPWLAIALTLGGALSSYTAWRHRCQGNVGTLATMADNSFYSAALTVAAASSASGYDLGFAVAHGLMVLMVPSRIYGLTLPYAAVMGLPLVLGLVLRPAPSVGIILVSTYVVSMTISIHTAKQRALAEAQSKLSQAVTATDKLAEESVQVALSTTLLSLGNFLHELRNAQTAVRASLEYLAERGELDGEARAALEDALLAQTNEQELVVETIDSLKRRVAPDAQRFYLQHAVEHVAAKSPDVEIEDHLARKVVVRGLEEHMVGVLINLVRNAEQAGARRVVVALDLDRTGEAVEMLVHDDGPGFPARLRATVFQAFSSEGKAHGTGLGLYLCRRYVELFGGTIALEDGPLGGAGFRIRVPARFDEEPSPP